MNLNLHAAALWIGLIGGAIGIYVPIHSQLQEQKKEVQANTDNSIKEALERQHILDSINVRFANDEAAIAAVASQLPIDKRDILNAVQNAQTKAQSQNVMFQKSMTMKPGYTKAITPEAGTAADATAIKKEDK